jgi:recombination protein RecT
MTEQKNGQVNGEEPKSLTRYEKYESFLPTLVPKLKAVWLKTVPFDEERFVGIALNLFLRKPDVLMCEPISVIGALKTCAEYALYPDDLRGHCWIIPRWDRHIGRDRANFQLGYKGIVTLLRRAEVAGKRVVHAGKAVEAELVYKDDRFELEKGLNPRLVFEPNLEADDDEKRELRLAYAMINYREGPPDFGYLSARKLKEIEDVYVQKPKDKSKERFTPWNQSTISRAWMQKKCAIVQVSKLSPALDDDTVSSAIALDEKLDAGLNQDLQLAIDREDAELAAKMLSEDSISTVVVESAPIPVEGKSSLDLFVEGKDPKPVEVKPEHNEPPPEDKGKIDKGTDPPKDKDKPEPSPPPPQTEEATEKKGLKEERARIAAFMKENFEIIKDLWEPEQVKAIMECKAIKDLRFYAGQVQMKKRELAEAKAKTEPQKPTPDGSNPPPPDDKDAPPDVKSGEGSKGAQNETSQASAPADDWSSLME